MYREKEGDFKKKRDFTSSEDFLELKKLFEKIKKERKLTNIELIQKLEEEEIIIPISIFNDKLSSLEVVVKYLKENLNLRNRDIAKLINRSDKTVYQAYHSAQEKFSENLEIESSEYYFPVKILADRTWSVLENIVKFLYENCELNYSEIGRLLKRDPRTIWTVYQRGRKK